MNATNALKSNYFRPSSSPFVVYDCVIMSDVKSEACNIIFTLGVTCAADVAAEGV